MNEWRLCVIVRSLCSLFCSIFRCISLSVIPCRGTTKWCRSGIAPSPAMVFTLPAESKESNIFCFFFHDPFVSFFIFRLIAPTLVLPRDVRMEFFQVTEHELLIYPMIVDIENVADVSKQLDILTSAISINLKRPPCSLGCKPILRRSPRQRNQAILI